MLGTILFPDYLAKFEPIGVGRTSRHTLCSVDICFYILVLQKYCILTESRITIKLLARVIVVALSCFTHEHSLQFSNYQGCFEFQDECYDNLPSIC